MAEAKQPKLVDGGQTGFTPWQLIQNYDDGSWEEFIVEWTDGFQPPYHKVVKLGGAGDKGRDLVAYLDDPTKPSSPWDAYQCKHYQHPLRPTDIYVELAKLCFYTHRGDYTIPRRYRFVSPRGVGTKLHDMLKKPDVLRADLYTNWDTYCLKEIASTDIPLNDGLRKYIDRFDFSMVWFLTPQEIIEQHERTKHWYRRFKITPPQRPEVTSPPADVGTQELGYVGCLLDAYSDHLKRPISTVVDIAAEVKLSEHFKRSRYCFYSAEALARFSRDHFVPGSFDVVKRHVYDGVVDITLQDHADGFKCVLAVTNAATSLQPPASDVTPHVSPADKIGICHHLANDGSMKWCNHE
jgi:hypothetical protein